MKKGMNIAIAAVVLLLAFVATQLVDPSITGMHHTAYATRIVRRDAVSVPCTDAGAKVLGERFRLWNGCRDTSNICGYAVLGGFVRENKITVDCAGYKDWKNFIANCNRYYHESCNMNT